jgi:hypothetical protein
VACAVSPFVESAVGSDNNIFLTGYDTESTLAVVMLLLELALSLASLLILFCPSIRVNERVVTKHLRLSSDFGFRITILDTSPPVPLRI